jgi:hypothetical protein
MRKYILLYILIMLIPVIGISQTKYHSYFNRYSNKMRYYMEHRSEIIVTFDYPDKTSSDNQMDIMLRKYNVTELVKESQTNIAVYRLENKQQYQHVVSGLRSLENVSGVYPVLITSEGNSCYYIPDHITIMFHKEVPAEQINRIVDEMKCTIITKHYAPGYYTLKVQEGTDIFKIINKLNEFKEVKIAELDFITIKALDYVPSDPLFDQQWALNNTLQYGGIRNADIFAMEAWDITRGDPDVHICILDDGIDLLHNDLYPNIYQNLGEDADHDSKTFEPNGYYDTGDFDNIDNDSNGIVDDLCGYNFVSVNHEIIGGTHGTNCASIAAAVSDNSQGISGVAPLSTIVPIKIMQSEVLYASAFINAIYYTINTIKSDYPTVISCSWHKNNDENDAMHIAMKDARAAGISLFFASGNVNHNNVNYPGIYPEAISVGGTNMCDTRWVKNACNYYPDNTWGSCYGPNLDISAPAQQIYSADYEGNAGYVAGDYDDTFTGTSASVPCASGTAALLLAQDNTLDPWQIQEILQNSADKVGGYNYNYNSQKPGHSLELGYGRINAFRAVLSRIFMTEKESNNSYSTANGPIISQMNMAGTISSSGEADWYYFDVTQAGQVKISIFGQYKEWFLYSNPSGNHLCTGSVNYEDRVNTSACSLSAQGRYYLKVTSTFTGNYDFCITGNLLSGALFESEPNNSATWSDGLINPNQIVSAQLESSSDADWFWFEVTAAGTITVTSNTSGKTWSLYSNPSGPALKTATGTSSYYISTAGRYYIKYTGTTGIYDFKISGNLASCIFESEGNNDYLSADGHITNNKIVTGDVATSSDADWFYIRITQPGTLTLKINGNYKNLDLYSNPEGSLLKRVSVGSQSSATGTYSITQAGLYFLKVTGMADAYYFSVSGNLSIKEAETPIDVPGDEIQNSSHVAWMRNYPNPFSQETTIDFELTENSQVTLKVFNMMGEEICELVNEEMEAGIHSVIWKVGNSAHVENGIYIYRIEINGNTMCRRMVLMP